MLNFYQHLPEHINPIALSIGFFSVQWYAIMYLIAFATVYVLLKYRLKREENKVNNFQTNSNPPAGGPNLKFIGNLFLYVIIGLLIGARLGYVLLYNFSYYIHNPLGIIWPFSSNGNFVGILGMSYYGGLVGIIVAGLIFCRKYKINFWQLADFIIPAIPLGYFFGRIGNFLNGELYGRVTNKFWGMYFPSDPLVLRHPSQLYEAFFEGIVLFVILWLLRNKKTTVNGQWLIVYMFLYGFLRFIIEFFREPDPQIGLIFNSLTLGQVFSLIMLVFSGYLFFQLPKRKENI